jgi:hypothetical protein
VVLEKHAYSQKLESVFKFSDELLDERFVVHQIKFVCFASVSTTEDKANVICVSIIMLLSFRMLRRQQPCSEHGMGLTLYTPLMLA